VCNYTISVNEKGEGINPDAPTDNGGKGSSIEEFFKKLLDSHFPLWQICTGIVAIILILIFTGKTISYGNKKRAAKKEAKKYNERSYTAAAAMLPIFAADEVLFGLSNKIWSIIAFALVGACVLMFIIMLLTRHSWKKAELAKEQAIEDDARRKEEAQDAKREEAETKRSAKEQEAEARMIAMQRELEEKRLAMQQEAEAKRAAWEDEEREERRRQEARRIAREEEAEAKRLAWENEEREERRREEARREKRYREEYEKREEELFRRDEAMKMMFATMLNNMKADIPRAAQNTDDIVDKVVAKLLPAMQQMIPQAVQQMLPQSSEGGKEIVYIPYPVGDTEDSATVSKT
ncbi:MAG: hypothetical protein K2I79_01010, partial [Clostridia bacterium]|nr:hypothetical protein [Clostridia bacterium]